MGRKIWLWIIAGLAILLALGVTAAIVLGSLQGDAPEPEAPGVSQEQTEGQEQPQEPVPSEQDTTEGSVEEPTQGQTQAPTQEPTQEQTEQPTQQPTQGQSSQTGGSGGDSDLIYPDPGNANQLPMG